MQDLQEVTQDFHYENYRGERLARQKRASAAPDDGNVSEKDRILQEKEAELKRMKEMLTAMQAQIKQQN